MVQVVPYRPKLWPSVSSLLSPVGRPAMGRLEGGHGLPRREGAHRARERRGRRGAPALRTRRSRLYIWDVFVNTRTLCWTTRLARSRHCKHRNNNALLCVTENRIALPLARTPEAPHYWERRLISCFCFASHVGHSSDGPPALVAHSPCRVSPALFGRETRSRRGTHSSDSVHSAKPPRSPAPELLTHGHRPRDAHSVEITPDV